MTAAGGSGEGADPLPGAADFAAAALALGGADVAVLLDDGADAGPDALALAQRVLRAQDVVTEVREEQERVLASAVAVAVAILISVHAQALLVREALEYQVHEGGDAGGGGAAGADAAARPEEGQQGADHSANLEAISRHSEPERSSDRARDGKPSERGG